MLKERARHVARHPVQSVVRLATHGLVRAQTDGRVVDGPFAGMWYAIRMPHLPAYLGTYELELRPLLARLEATRFDVVLNVGAADGLYAAGLARLWPAAQIVAFELRADKRANARRVADANNLGPRVRIEGECTPERLDQLAGAAERPLVWIDVDGAEVELLDLYRAPGLRRAEIVVELHEHLVPGVRDLLEARFASSHAANVIPGRERRLDEFPLRRRLWRTAPGRGLAREAMQERRPVVQNWLHLAPTTSA